MEDKDKEELYQAGSFIAHTINKLENKEKHEILRAHIGAMLILVDLKKDEKLRILEEVKNEFLGRNKISEKSPDYIG